MTTAGALLAMALAATARPQVLPSKTFGDVQLVWPAGEPDAAVVLLEGDGGWEPRMRDLAAALAGSGALVLGVDTRRYTQRSRGPRCAYAAGDLEVLSQSTQKALALPEYLKPVLVGYSSGATLAYAALAQAPLGTFAGAVSVGFCADLPTAAPLCAGEGLRRVRRGGRDVLSPSPVRAPWKLYAGTRDRSCRIDDARAFAAGVSGAEVVALENLGHDYATREPWMARVGADVQAMTRAARPAPPRMAEESVVSDLPLVEVPARAAGPLLAVLVTGDGGWAGIDRALADRLSAADVAVVGLDSLRYFWSRKTPAQLGADLQRIAAHYTTVWNRQEVVFVGYSRGADVVPAAMPFLGDLAPRLRLVALLGPGLDAELEIHVADLFTGGPKGEPILPLAKTIAAPLLCVYGAEEASVSICPQLQDRARTRVVALPGGHHFDGDYEAVAQLILDELR